MTPAVVVELVRNVFGLNVGETAEVFNVSRATIYKWETLDDIDLVRSATHKERIRDVYRATRFWQELHPTLKGRWQQDMLPFGGCLLDLLKRPEISHAEMEVACRYLVETNDRRQREEGERAKKAGDALCGVFERLSRKG